MNEPVTSSTRHRTLLWGGATAVWLAAVVAGLVGLTQYKMTAGPEAAPEAAERWPGSSLLSLDAQRPTLLVTVHPHCPCTRATFTELNKLLEAQEGKLTTQLLFVQPEGEDAGFVKGPLWERAANLPGAHRVIDVDGAESKRLGAATSGTVLLYAPDGALLFRGGLTIARGHEGDSPGAERIAALLAHQPAEASAPVFGCALEQQEEAD